MSTYIQAVPLLLNSTKEVKAELFQGVSVDIIRCCQEKWMPAMEAYIAEGKKKPEHAHWNWLQKTMAAILSGKEELLFSVRLDSLVQGLMFIDKKTAYFGQDFGKHNVYVHFLEVAPWNYFKDEAVGYYQGVGTALLVAAIEYSDSIGCEGRIALESLPQSVDFYYGKGMVPVEKNGGSSQLPYFELPTQNAQKMLRGMRK